MSHPYVDPWHAQATITGGQILTNRMLFRKQPYTQGMLAGAATPAGSPLSGTGDAIGEVLHSAGYGRAEPVASDADPPTQAVQSDGENLYHVRHSGNGPTVTPLGHDDLGGGDGD